MGHLIHGEETDWVPRARIILEHGAARFAGWSLPQLLDCFAELRRTNLAILRSWNLTEAQLDLPGRHADLGAVTLRQLRATWAVHDLNHIAQIARVLARRSTDDVGPWPAYLSILNRQRCSTRLDFPVLHLRIGPEEPKMSFLPIEIGRDGYGLRHILLDMKAHPWLDRESTQAQDCAIKR